MKKIFASSLRNFLSIAITIAFLVYIYISRHSILGTLTNLHSIYLIPIFLGQLGIQLSNALLLKATLKPLSVSIGYAEAFKLVIVSSFVNFFTPVVGGAGARAIYLKREHNLNYSTFVGVVYANYLIIFLVTFLVGLGGLVTIGGALHKSVGDVVATFFAAGAAGSGLFMAWGHKLTGFLSGLQSQNLILKKLIEKIAVVDEGWSAIRRDRRAMLMMSLWSAATMLSIILVYWAAMHSIGLDSSLSVAIVFAALALVGLLLNITPGSVGIREAIYASIYAVTAISAQHVVAFSLVDRITQLLVLGVGWTLFGNSILRGISRTSKNL